MEVYCVQVHPCEKGPKPRSIGWVSPGIFEAEECGVVTATPLLAIFMSKPSDGLPLYQPWCTVASDVFHTGFESWRGVIEVKTDKVTGSDLDFGCTQATKGLGRLSVLLFGVLRTYLAYQHSLSDEQTNDFTRPGMQVWVVDLKQKQPLPDSQGFKNNVWKTMRVVEND